MNATTSGSGLLDVPVSVDELEQAWRAVRAGQFRGKQGAVDDGVPSGGGPAPIPAPVVLVAGAHGWSGTSTAALLIADAAARRGTAVRLVDAAAAPRSGFAAASATEHGLDETGRWRVGSRDGVTVQRLAQDGRRAAAVPVPPAAQDGTCTVVDAGWPLPDLLEDLDAGPDGGHWLGTLLRAAPLVLTARSTVPGLRQVEAAVEALNAVRGPGGRVVLALLGSRRLPRTLTTSAGAAALAAQRDRLLVTVPDRAALAATGLSPAPLPRQLQPAGDQLLALTTHPDAATERWSRPPGSDPGPGMHLIGRLSTQFTIHRKDDQR